MKTIRSLKVMGGLFGAMLIGLFTSSMAAAAGYYAQNGKIYDPASQEIQIRGISHFGFNADILMPQYLWEMGWKEQIAQIKSLGFNAVRVPYVPDTLYVTTKVNQLGYVDPNKNPELIDKTPLQVLDLWMAEANRQGLYVMLDFHSLSKVNQYQTWFVDDPNAYGFGKYAATWNGQPYTAENWKRDLAFVAARYAHLPYFFAIDIFNEPQAIVRWSTGDANAPNPKNFWKPAAEGAAAAILAANPRLLIFVQGINANNDGIEKPNVPINWGENFQPQRYQPLNIPFDKLVLSPHTYGPDVYVKTSFSAPNYPANLAADWETLFGQFSSQHPVVIGEWGGRYGQGGVGQKDVQWQNALVDYLLSKNIRSSFYWCYTPNSGDSGGILDDNLNVRQDKMALLQRHWGGASPPPPPPPSPPPPPPSPAPQPTVSTLALSGSAYTVAQSAGKVTITVNRTGSSAGTASVKYATANGTARSGSDYTARSGTLSWASGNTTPKSFTVTISKAVLFTGSRSFSVSLSNASTGAAAGAPSTASVTINGSKPAPPQAYTQPYIMSFSPASGPLGTVVTVLGSGFTGVNTAWIGEAHDAPVSVINDTQVRVTIPAGATSGAIGIFNPAGASFTASAFTVTYGTQTYTQPYIMSFSPTSGPVGTVVTLNGSGFTGVNNAWVGDSRQATVSVVSDTQVKVTIPANATTGAIGLFNPAGVSFTASAFTRSP